MALLILCLTSAPPPADATFRDPLPIFVDYYFARAKVDRTELRQAIRSELSHEGINPIWLGKYRRALYWWCYNLSLDHAALTGKPRGRLSWDPERRDYVLHAETENRIIDPHEWAKDNRAQLDLLRQQQAAEIAKNKAESEAYVERVKQRNLTSFAAKRAFSDDSSDEYERHHNLPGPSERRLRELLDGLRGARTDEQRKLQHQLHTELTARKARRLIDTCDTLLQQFHAGRHDEALAHLNRIVDCPPDKLGLSWFHARLKSLRSHQTALLRRSRR